MPEAMMILYGLCLRDHSAVVMMNDMAARGNIQQTHPAYTGNGPGAAWPEPGAGLRPAVSSAAGTLERRSPTPLETPPVRHPAASTGAPAEPAAAQADAAPAADDAFSGRYESVAALELALRDRLTDQAGEEVRLSAGPGATARARRLTLSALESWAWTDRARPRCSWSPNSSPTRSGTPVGGPSDCG